MKLEYCEESKTIHVLSDNPIINGIVFYMEVVRADTNVKTGEQIILEEMVIPAILSSVNTGDRPLS